MVQPRRQGAEPILLVHESQASLEIAVEPQPRELRRFVVLHETLEIGPAKADAHGPEIAEIRQTEDQQTMEVRVVGIAFEKSAGVRSDDCRLYRPDAGQLLEAVEVGVEQDAAVPDERHRS